jgi:hypothetical protein
VIGVVNAPHISNSPGGVDNRTAVAADKVEAKIGADTQRRGVEIDERTNFVTQGTQLRGAGG